jgi:hypothetical protein
MKYDPHDIGPEIELERRLTLMRNGYGPVPLTPGIKAQPEGGLLGSKAPILKGWSKIDYGAPDIEATIRSWQDHSVSYGYSDGGGSWMTRIPSRTTGIHAPAVIDVDVDDPAAARIIMDVLAEALGADFNSCPIRSGKGHKFCLVAGTKERVQHRWPGADMISPDGETKGCIEVFYNQGQIGVSGVHSYHVDENGRVGSPAILYDWFNGPTPFDTPLQELPKFRKAKLLEAARACNDALAALGWTELPSDRSSRGPAGAFSYTLPTDVLFDTLAHGLQRYEDLDENDRVAMHSILGTGGDRSRGWCFVKTIAGERWVGVHDHKSGINYLPAEATPKPQHEVAAKVAEITNERLARLSRAIQPTRPRRRPTTKQG